MTIFLFACIYFLVKEFEEASNDNTLPRSWGAWWNNDTGWINKHTWGIKAAEKLRLERYETIFYHLFRTAFAFVTDAPHALQLLKFIVLSVMLGVVVAPIAGAWFILGVYFGGLIKELMKFAGIKWII